MTLGRVLCCLHTLHTPDTVPFDKNIPVAVGDILSYHDRSLTRLGPDAYKCCTITFVLQSFRSFPTVLKRARPCWYRGTFLRAVSSPKFWFTIRQGHAPSNYPPTSLPINILLHNQSADKNKLSKVPNPRKVVSPMSHKQNVHWLAVYCRQYIVRTASR